MAKPKFEGENKVDKFRRIASLRTQRILNDLRLLGNCSNNSFYSYTQEDISKIFTVIDKELRRVKNLFNKHRDVFKL